MSGTTLPKYWDRQKAIWGLRGIDPSERLLLLALCYHSGDKPICWPGQQLLSDETRISERQVRRWIRSLEDRGWLIVESGKPNRYRLVWTAIVNASSDAGKADTHVRLPDPRDRTSETPNRTPMSSLTGHQRPPNAKEHLKEERKACNAVSSNGVTIAASDLRSPVRTEALFRKAVDLGFVHETDRLNWHTLARHVAGRKGIKNPGGLMMALARQRDWDGSNTKEDEARLAIREMDRMHTAQPTGLVADVVKKIGLRIEPDDQPRDPEAEIRRLTELWRQNEGRVPIGGRP